MSKKIIQQGAEAIIIKDKNIIKKRISKSYRIKFLDDKIRKSRTKSESKIIEKISKVIPVPKILKVSLEENEIEMSFIDGKKLSESLDNLKNSMAVCKKIGENIAKIHDLGIIHGDLTTSNMILKENELYFIDFGLGYFSNKTEDKAVDLHLIRQALEAKHFLNYEKFFEAVLKGYEISKGSQETLKRLEIVEKRGRYKRASCD